MSDQVMPFSSAADEGRDDGAREEEYMKEKAKGSENTEPNSDHDGQPMSYTDSEFSIHMLAIALATDSTAPNPLLLVAAFATNFAKALVLGAMAFDSAHTRCTTNADCASGLWCGGFDMGTQPTDAPTYCDECIFATLFEPPADHVQLYADGAAHCASAPVTACAYVEKNRKQMNYLTVLLIVFAGLRAGQMLIVDLGQLAREQLIFMQTIGRVQRAELRAIARFFNFFNFCMRAYVIPCWASAAICMIVISWAPTTRNILFGGVVVSSAFSVDTFVSQAVMGFRHQELIRRAIKGVMLRVPTTPSTRAATNMPVGKDWCRSKTVNSLAFDLSGFGYARALPAQQLYCLLLSLGVAAYLLIGADPFVEAVAWLVLLDPMWMAPDISSTLQFLSLMPCIRGFYVAMYLPVLLTLIAIPMELLFTTYAEDAPMSADARCQRRWPRLAQSGFVTVLKMLTIMLAFPLMQPCLANLQFRSLGESVTSG